MPLGAFRQRLCQSNQLSLTLHTPTMSANSTVPTRPADVVSQRRPLQRHHPPHTLLSTARPVISTMSPTPTDVALGPPMPARRRVRRWLHSSSMPCSPRRSNCDTSIDARIRRRKRWRRTFHSRKRRWRRRRRRPRPATPASTCRRTPRQTTPTTVASVFTGERP